MSEKRGRRGTNLLVYEYLFGVVVCDGEREEEGMGETKARARRQ